MRGDSALLQLCVTTERSRILHPFALRWYLVFMLPVCFWVFVFHLGATFSNSQEKSSEVEGISQAFVAFCTGKGIKVLSRHRLQRIIHRLSDHHSRDFSFLRCIAKTMTTYEAYPWKCHCGRINAKRAEFLSLNALLTGPQAVGIQRNPVPNTAAKATRSPSQQQIGVIRTGKGRGSSSQSPRWRQQSSPRHRHQPSGKKKNRGKGKTRDQSQARREQTEQFPAFGPPVSPPNHTDTPWFSAAATLGTPTTSAGGGIRGREKIEGLSGTLQKAPAELTAGNAAASQRGSYQAGRSSHYYHAQASEQSRQSPQGVGGSTCSKAETSIPLGVRSLWIRCRGWQTYSVNFQQQEAQLAERVNVAIQALEAAKTELTASKKSLGETSPEDDSMQTAEGRQASPASQREHFEQRSSYYRRFAAPFNLFARAQRTGRSGGRDRKAVTQTASHFRSCRRCSNSNASRCTRAAFSCGRACMTLLYAVQWPLAADADLVPKWTHSILSENPCRSEWAAQASASFLAFELGQSTFHVPGDVPVRTCKRRGALQVSFATEVHVLIGLEDSLSCCSVRVLPEVLQSPCKPWALRPPGYQPSPPPKFIPLEGEGPIWEDVKYQFLQIPELSHPCWTSCLYPLEDSHSECLGLFNCRHDQSLSCLSWPTGPALPCPDDFGDPLSPSAVLISGRQCVPCPGRSQVCQSCELPRRAGNESSFSPELTIDVSSAGFENGPFDVTVDSGCFGQSPEPSLSSCVQPVAFSYPHQSVDEDDFDGFNLSESSILSFCPVTQVGSLTNDGSQSVTNPFPQCVEQLTTCIDQAPSGDPLSAQAVLISEGVLDVTASLDQDLAIEALRFQEAELVSVSSGSTTRPSSPVGFADVPVQLDEESSDEQIGQAKLTQQAATQHMSIVQHKLSDAGPSQSAQYASTPGVTPEGFPFEFELPAFVREMIIHLPAGFTDQPRPVNEGPLVRIWYIHLDFQVRSFQQRQLQLTGPPHFWRSQIVAVWFDALAPHQDVAIDLVAPIPPRKWYERSLVFDVILSQSTFVRLKPALVTVLPNPVARSLQLYSGAVALDVQITGNQAIQAIAAERLCAERFCQVTFGHQVIPNDGPAAHLVSAGNGFVVHIGRQRSQAAGSADEVVMTMHMPMDVEESHISDSEPALASQGPDAPRLPPQPALRERNQPSVPALLYALNKPAKHAMVRPHLPQCLLNDVANVFGVQPSQISGLHFVHATPVGEPPLSVHIIVQLIGDVVPGSMEQLLLLDVAFQCHGFPVQPCVQMPVDRRVVLLPQSLVRARLLDIAFIGTYCELHGHRCLVSLNRQPWKQQDVMINGLSSGGYLRIEVPPPHASGAHTCHAVELVEDIGLDETQPHFVDHYPDLPETSVTRVRSRVTEKTSARHDSPPNVLPEAQ